MVCSVNKQHIAVYQNRGARLLMLWASQPICNICSAHPCSADFSKVLCPLVSDAVVYTCCHVFGVCTYLLCSVVDCTASSFDAHALLAVIMKHGGVQVSRPLLPFSST